MSKRRRLADRRPSETRSFNCNGLPYTCTTSCFADGSLTEIFLGNAKAAALPRIVPSSAR
jgi:hypothetical protein